MVFANVIYLFMDKFVNIIYVRILPMLKIINCSSNGYYVPAVTLNDNATAAEDSSLHNQISDLFFK